MGRAQPRLLQTIGCLAVSVIDRWYKDAAMCPEQSRDILRLSTDIRTVCGLCLSRGLVGHHRFKKLGRSVAFP